jgi:glycosyltransferase involved in cell wall biosynthesis
MKILIKANPETKRIIENGNYSHHCCYYYPFSFYKTFQELGHEVKMFGEIAIKGMIYGEEYEIITDYTGYDMMFWRALESYVFDKEFSLKTITEFKGIHCFHLGSNVNDDFLKNFNYIFPAEMLYYEPFYRNLYPNTKIKFVNFHSPCFDFLDRDSRNPYPKDNTDFKLIYTGLFQKRYLKLMIRLAEKGEKIWLAGQYRTNDKSGNYHLLTDDIKKTIHPNITLLTPTGVTSVGDHFPWLKYADAGLNFYPDSYSGAISSKIIEYLCCGLPVICDNVTPNSFRITELNAGSLYKFNDFNSLYKAVLKEKKLRRNKEEIKNKAREVFDIKKVCSTMLEFINENE